MTTTVTEPATTGLTGEEPEVILEGQRGTATGQVTNVEGRQVTVVIPYDVRDTHGTSWKAGVFADTLRSGAVIPVVFNHDEGRVCGRIAGHRETPSHLELDLLLADPEKVADAATVKSLLDDKMIEGVSFKFRNGVAERDPNNARTARIRSAHLAHLSFVVDASIPGARVVGVRGAADIAGVAQLVDTGVIHASEGRSLLGLEGGAPTRAAGDDDVFTLDEDGVRCARATDAAVTQAVALLDDVDIDALPDGVRDAVGLVVAASVASEQLRDALGLPAPEFGARAADKPYGDVEYADTGLQDDGKKRYPLDTEEHVRAAWSYINQEANAAKYSAEDLKKVKDAIKAAAGKLGVEISDDGERAADDVEADAAYADAMATLNLRRGDGGPKA